MARNVLEGPGDAAGTPDGSGRCAAMILVIDNYDSFTYNLVQYLGELGADLEVVRNDATDIERIVAMAPERIVISPGPGTPDQAGVSLEVIRRLGSTTPVLGVCLGHQAIGQAYGGTVGRAETQMHGKVSMIRHDGRGAFAGVSNPLVSTRSTSPAGLTGTPPRAPEGTARAEDDRLPLARRLDGHRARDARGHGRGGGRRDHGAPPPPPSGRGRAVPPRVDPHDRRQAAPEKFPGDLPTVSTRATERQLIEIIRRAGARGTGVRIGIGDDCAVLEPGAGRLVLATTDLLVEDVHFRRRYATAADVGWKSLAVNLSDIASMGGRPRWALVALACPEDVTVEEAEAFWAGLLELARAHDVAVVGGDTSTSPRGWIVNVTLLGEAAPASVLRSTAKSGDVIAVTGTLGRAAAGLAVLERGTTPAGVAPTALDQVKAAHLRPRPRVREGQWLGAGLAAGSGRVLRGTGEAAASAAGVRYTAAAGREVAVAPGFEHFVTGRP